MSRRKQKFPIHLKNENPLKKGGNNIAETKEKNMEFQPEEFDAAKDGRVPINGQVVTLPISSSYLVPYSGKVEPHTNNVPVERTNILSSSPSLPILVTSSSGKSSGNNLMLTSTGKFIGSMRMKRITSPLSVSVSGTSSSRSSCNSAIVSAKIGEGELMNLGPPKESSKKHFTDSAINLLNTVTSSANSNKVPRLSESKTDMVLGDETSKTKLSVDYPFTCPVCHESYKSKRGFNAHIIVHCQLVNGSNNGPKRSIGTVASPSPDKKRIRENAYNEQLESVQNRNAVSEDTTLPLDLSCRAALPFKDCDRPAASSTPLLNDDLIIDENVFKTMEQNPILQELGNSEKSFDHSSLSERGPREDENENLVNEAREKENSFFNTAQNQQYLTEDSTWLDPPPPLPLYGTGGSIQHIRVSNNEGPPMVYSVRLHAEQVLSSRILGINEETGDKMELYKCFLCREAFPSISRLQVHLSQHKQRFVCSKCHFSCDSRVQFSQHVQNEHLSIISLHTHGDKTNGPNNLSDNSNSAENTVTVAALLSALREKTRDNKAPFDLAPKETYEGEDDDHGSEESYPLSPLLESQDGEMQESKIAEDLKMYACKFCGKKFDKAFSCNRHETDSCPVSPTSESQEAGELQESKNGEDIFKMYTCKFCGKKFDRAFSCNRHERVHTGYKPCFCHVCGRGFSEPRNLRHHVIRFHSDGSLRHLIKRVRRKKCEEDPHKPISPVPIKYPECHFKDVLKETANKLITSSNIDMTSLASQTNGLEITLTTNIANQNEKKKNSDSKSSQLSNSEANKDEQSSSAVASSVTTYTTNLTKIIAASLDNSTRSTRRHPNFQETFRHDELEPGEIRLDRRSKVIDDGESGRRLVIVDEQSEEGLDHSPQFSNYAPRLNIIQEPIDRDKALVPITDDVGRTFFECPYCHKFFGGTSDMKRHLDFHEDLRPYNCEYCDYSARTNSQLKVHKMRHEGIKLYSCDVCNYNGVTQSDLTRHKKTQSHISRSQNVCSMCGLGFYSASQKEVHVVQCHPEVEGASSLLQMSLGTLVAVEGASSSFIQMSMGPPVAPLMTSSEFSSLSNPDPSTSIASTSSEAVAPEEPINNHI